MDIHYHELIGKRVIQDDGQPVGHLSDLVAERRGDALCVTTLLVGETELVRRIGFKRVRLPGVSPPRTIPWRLVTRIETDIYVHPSGAAGTSNET